MRACSLTVAATLMILSMLPTAAILASDRLEPSHSSSSLPITVLRQLGELDESRHTDATSPVRSIWAAIDVVPVQDSRFDRGRFEERRREFGRDSGRDFNRDSGSSSRTANSTSPAAAAKPVPKAKVLIPLPSAYVAFDKNGDQQIGFYEWDRARILEFLALDRNGDGFLTPKELVNAPAPGSIPVPAVTAVSATNSPATSMTTIPTPTGVATAPPAVAPPAEAKVSSTPGGTPPTAASTPAPAPAGGAESAEGRRAKYFFSITDKNKDGQIADDEWAGSRGVRMMFERGQITPQLPLSEAAFIEQFLKLQPAR